MEKNIILSNPESIATKIPLRDFMYILNRIFFVLYPFNLILVKFIDLPYFSFWKDVIVVLNFIYFLTSISSDKFLFRFIAIVLGTLIIDILLDRLYFEYLYWFILGLPVYNYFKDVKKEHWDFDVKVITIFMCLGAFWIFFFESSGAYGYFFVPEKEGFTLQRGDTFRMRYCFVSPMALSQFSWFSLVLLNINQRIKVKFKFIATLLILYVLIIGNTRAGILLLVISFVTFIYCYYFKPQKWVIIFIISSSCFVIFYQMLSNATSASETSSSDALRFLRFNTGIESIKSNWLVGLGGERFSPRTQYFTEVSNFENSWLSLIYCFGIAGAFIMIGILSKLLNNIFLPVPKFLYFSVPWVVYSLIFPILQEAIPIYITWSIISYSINQKKFQKLCI